MFKDLLSKLGGDPSSRAIAQLLPLVDEINTLEPEFEKLSDADLRAKTEEFKAYVREQTAAQAARLAEVRAQIEAEEEDFHRRRLEYELKEAQKALRQAEDAALNELIPEAFAAVREAAKRTIGQRHYDVQLVGGIILHQGKIAEMKTGEGKTLVATLPLYLNALAGHGCHLVTPNDYLSKFGAQWMGPIYHLLGLSVGVIQNAAADPSRGSFLFDPTYISDDARYQYLRPVTRREAYLADVTYGTNNEFGFDYLRDNMAWDLSQTVQRELHYAIVDEVDNILIDEARTPLIISGPAEEPSDYYRTFADIVRRLHPSHNTEEPEGDYVVDEKTKSVTLTEQGIEKVERILGIDNLYSPEHFELTPYLDNALRAQVVYHRDRDYIVNDAGEVIIVDEFTGRLMHGRRFSEGLHQAIEAKEGVQVQRESLTYATITFQNYFRMYGKLAGMTGTAYTEREEFFRIYNLDVVVLPTNIEFRASRGELILHKEKQDGLEIITYKDPTDPSVTYYKRIDYPDVVYKDEAAKFRAVVREIKELYEAGRPVLVGTTAIETSERLSRLLDRQGIPHQVLNAKQHEKEAGIIAQAGRPGTVTIATNMAGRGVDILLGGNPEGLAREALRKQGIEITEATPEQWQAALEAARAQVARDRQKVLELGGLHILGTERHEARRIDNQLRGRAGRQGDPGSSRFYISLEDELMRRFGGERVKNFMEWANMDPDEPITHSWLTKSIEQAQIRVEGYNFDIRKHVLEYDDVINKQREVIYAQRRQILEKPDLKPIILNMVHDELSGLVTAYTASTDPDEWDLNGLYHAVMAIMPLPREAGPRTWSEMTPSDIESQLHDVAEANYEALENAYGSDFMRQAERLTMLRVVDNHWVHHLTDLDILREGIGLRAYGQQDPLVAFKKEAFEMYEALRAAIQHDIVSLIYHVSPVPVAPERRPLRVAGRGGLQARPAARAAAPILHANRSDDGSRPAPARQTGLKPGTGQPVQIGRNDPCYCGSGRKYKHCHMRQDQGMVRAAQQPVAEAPRSAPNPRAKKRRKR